MENDSSIFFGVVGLILLMFKFGDSLLPTALRLIGSGMLVYFGYQYFGGMGMGLVVAGILSMVTSVFSIFRGFREITLVDGVVLFVGLIETIVGFVVGV